MKKEHFGIDLNKFAPKEIKKIKSFQKYQATIIFKNEIILNKLLDFEFEVDQVLDNLIELNKTHNISDHNVTYIEGNNGCIDYQLSSTEYYDNNDQIGRTVFKELLILDCSKDIRFKIHKGKGWKYDLSSDLKVVLSFVNRNLEFEQHRTEILEHNASLFDDFLIELSSKSKVPLNMIKFLIGEKLNLKNLCVKDKMICIISLVEKFQEIEKG